ncbi:uncharacterized protein CcaverHIS019_0210720 [Cutaneotrichosporon cavernicola]|uniref:BZIP domain-containing protein n=1 Tax=Cutaneotrichosporon cavernicola TaxID=279322 RepID=A0AA48I8C9_9TREE|nr:uncharacterized protein CcaverHIS019_0210720 [Cutaneotrichosporon cavernicola]BEI89710.1 hypothetical protein CcaverHIS019_0210720 [Cutaneotrichosporon cavernicola]
MDNDDVKSWLGGLDDAAMLTPYQAPLPETALGADEFLGPYVHPNTNGGNGMGPPSPSDFLFHGPKLPPIDSCRELASPLNPKKRKLDPPSPTHSVGKPLRPLPLPHRYEQYAFKPKCPSTASSSTRSTIQRRDGMPLAPMRRLDLSDDQDDMHDGEDEMDQDDVDGDELDSADESADHKSPRDPPFRQVTPSDASVELDDDYIPLSSIRSRAIGRSKHPRKVAKPNPKPVPKPKAPKAKIPENKATETKKTKLTRGAAGERRMSQNRSAQKKYRDKNKRLADLRSDFNLATIQATSEYKAGNITGDEAMERLTNASDYFRTEMTATCSMTGQRLEEEITEMDE